MTAQPRIRAGAVGWMASNPVAANLLMLLFVVGGLLVATRVKQEVFPEFTVDRISIAVPYPGASPEEVEQGIILAIEDAVRGLDGVKEVTANAVEGSGNVSIELLLNADKGKALQDVKNAVDRIQSFPEEAERPVVSLVEARRTVLSLMVHGDVSRRELRRAAERVRDELIQRDGITQVELAGAPPLEVAIEIPQEVLREHGLTLEGVAARVRATALELPGGGVRTSAGEILLRTQERRDLAEEFAPISIITRPDGSRVTLGDVADLRDGFAETDQEAYFNGKPAIRINVFRVGAETPQNVSALVYEWLEQSAESFEGIDFAVWDDRSELYRDRLNLLLKNFAIGLWLVLLMLGLFLDPRLAFWVTLGIPISILGSFLFIPLTGASINMISLFAFIVTLGIIVDDAVVVGENVFEKRQQGMPYLQAAIEGAREIAGPIVFAVLTNIAAFIPLFLVPGAQGKLFFQIPAVVVAVFIVSLIESLFILPAHLSHRSEPKLFWRVVGWPRRIVDPALAWFIRNIYRRSVLVAVKNRYATFACGVGMLAIAAGALVGGHLDFSYLPRLDADVVTAQATLNFGAPVEEARTLGRRLGEAAEAVAAEAEKTDGDILRGVFIQIGSPIDLGGPLGGGPGAGGSHVVGVQVALVPTDLRRFSSAAYASRWRESVGEVPGLEALTFTSEAAAANEAAIDVQMSHRDREVLDRAATQLAQELRKYKGVADIDDGVARGKRQISYTVRPEARALGIDSIDVARQLRGAFYGAEALRQQRGRNEVKVLVRLPESERRELGTIEEMVLISPTGQEIPLGEAVDARWGRSYTDIRRRDGRRVVSVSADVGPEGNANKILQEVRDEDLVALQRDFPGLNYSLEGEQRAQREAIEAMGTGFLLALLLIYALLAIPFRSYVQPLIVMIGIPFGMIGALIGHYLLGYEFSIISIFGLIALSGVVVNDSLVLVVTTNRNRDDGMNAIDAVVNAGSRRFRPILLTSVTTFFGLAPMMLETSVQARFLIPMAISLAFGVLFSTLVILLIVPSIYLIVEDFTRLFSAMVTRPEKRSREGLEGVASTHD